MRTSFILLVMSFIRPRPAKMCVHYNWQASEYKFHQQMKVWNVKVQILMQFRNSDGFFYPCFSFFLNLDVYKMFSDVCVDVKQRKRRGT